MQVDLRLHLQSFFFFQTSTVFFPPVFKYHIVFQDQSKDYVGKYFIIEMIKVIVIQYVYHVMNKYVSCFTRYLSHHRALTKDTCS